MKTEQIIMCVVALLLGMLVANMLTNVCGCKTTVEGLLFNEMPVDESINTAVGSGNRDTSFGIRGIARGEQPANSVLGFNGTGVDCPKRVCDGAAVVPAWAGMTDSASIRSACGPTVSRNVSGNIAQHLSSFADLCINSAPTPTCGDFGSNCTAGQECSDCRDALNGSCRWCSVDQTCVNATTTCPSDLDCGNMSSTTTEDISDTAWYATSKYMMCASPVINDIRHDAGLNRCRVCTQVGEDGFVETIERGPDGVQTPGFYCKVESELCDQVTKDGETPVVCAGAPGFGSEFPPISWQACGADGVECQEDQDRNVCGLVESGR